MDMDMDIHEHRQGIKTGKRTMALTRTQTPKMLTNADQATLSIVQGC
jgi:hypothetical protein